MGWIKGSAYYMWCIQPRHRTRPCSKGWALFLYENKQYQGHLGEHGLGHGRVTGGVCKARLKPRPCGMWCVQFLCIFENYELLRGLGHACVSWGGSCTPKLNCKYQHPKVWFRFWPKHKSCRKHLKVFRCQIWRCSDIVWSAKSALENSWKQLDFASLKSFYTLANSNHF